MQPVAPKTSRGIQEADVWAAADALLADGQKPTIEKVRQRIGRGSPNTVAPMLDAWFATLGARLGLNQQTEQLRNSVPNEVLEAAQALWSSALEHARQVAEQALQEREHSAAAREQELQLLHNRLAQREESLQQQKAAMDAALKLAHAQREDLSRRLDEMQQQLSEREQRLEKLHQENAQQRKAQEALREQHSRELEAAAQERQRLAEQFAGNERRMLGELDRSRMEADKLRKQMQEAERNAAARYEELHERHLQTEEELLTARTAQISLQQALDMASERIAELRQLLQARTAESAAGADATAEKPARSSRSLQRRALSQRAMRLGRKSI